MRKRLAAVFVVAVGVGLLAATASAGTAPPPQVTILFSRTAMTASDDYLPDGAFSCQADDAGIATVTGTVAPYLASLGLAPITGTVQTANTQPTVEWCSHYRETKAASWADLSNLASQYGWRFVSHSATYPSVAQWANMSADQVYAETCGSASALEAHGLSGATGMFAWPDNKVAPNALSDVEQCFDVSRRYGAGVSTASQVDNSPYYQSTRQLLGGHCDAGTSQCPSDSIGLRYSPPQNAINQINGLQPGQWLTIQVYLLVTGTNPAYTKSHDRWDCTSSDPTLHWANDAERYCFSDFQQVMTALASKVAQGQIVITDPATAATRLGRHV